MSDAGSEHEKELDLSNSDVVTKYKKAAEIVNSALNAVVDACKPGARVVDLCDLGDNAITEACSKVYKGKNIEKGIANPTCISCNNCVGGFSPLSGDATELKEGDVAKIDLGCHIDGFVATAATTVVVGATGPVTGRAADVVAAARDAFEAALRLIRPGKAIADVPGPLQQVAEAYGCTMVEGVISHQVTQFIIDGMKCVLNKPTPEMRSEDGEFEENEVYGIDIVVSTGEGKSRVKDEKETTVYKLNETGYRLKLQASRALFSEIKKRFPTMPFTLRALEGKQSRLGLVECLNHGLLDPYPVLYEKHGELVAQIKGTVLLMPNGSDRVTVAPLPEVNSDKTIEDEDLKKLLATSVKSKKKSKSKKKAAANGEGEKAAA